MLTAWKSRDSDNTILDPKEKTQKKFSVVDLRCCMSFRNSLSFDQQI